MKNVFFKSMFATVVAAMAFTACSSDVEDVKTPVGKQHITFSASVDGTTRTGLNGLDVYWEVTDYVGIYDENDASFKDFNVTNIEGTSAVIDANVTVSDKYLALYPYQEGISMTQESASRYTFNSVEIPTTQHAVEGGFDPKANIMTAVTSNNELAFKQVCAYAKITLPAGCTPESITVYGGEDNELSGKFNISVNATGILADSGISAVESNCNYVKLVGENSAKLGNASNETTYYIALKPGVLDMLAVLVKFVNGARYEGELGLYKVSQPQEGVDAFKRGKIVDLGTVAKANGWLAQGAQ